jgi:hypothetical protein
MFLAAIAGQIMNSQIVSQDKHNIGRRGRDGRMTRQASNAPTNPQPPSTHQGTFVPNDYLTLRETPSHLGRILLGEILLGKDITWEE